MAKWYPPNNPFTSPESEGRRDFRTPTEILQLGPVFRHEPYLPPGLEQRPKLSLSGTTIPELLNRRITSVRDNKARKSIYHNTSGIHLEGWNDDWTTFVN